LFCHFKSLLRRFVQRELTQDFTPLQLIKIDLTDEKNLVSPKSVDIGLGAELVHQTDEGNSANIPPRQTFGRWHPSW